MMASLRRLPLRLFHRGSAFVLGAFLAVHLANHAAGLASQSAHMEFMQAVRPLYRNAVVEPLLLGLLGFQVISGSAMVIRGWSARRGKVAWLQAVSGIYLALFVVLHTSAVLAGRGQLHLDTDFRFAAAGFHVPGWAWYFWPYYSLAVLAVFAHVGSAFYWRYRDRNRSGARLMLSGMALTGAVLGLLIAFALSGNLYPVEIPASYKATYGSD